MGVAVPLFLPRAVTPSVVSQKSCEAELCVGCVCFSEDAEERMR